MQTVVGLVVCLAAGPGAVLPRNAECKLGRLARKRTLYDLIIQNTTLAPIRRECGGSLCSALLRVLVDVRAWHLHLSRLHHSEATVRSHGHQTHHGRAPNWPNPPWQPSWPRWLWLAAGMNTGEKGKNMQKRWVNGSLYGWCHGYRRGGWRRCAVLGSTMRAESGRGASECWLSQLQFPTSHQFIIWLPLIGMSRCWPLLLAPHIAARLRAPASLGSFGLLLKKLESSIQQVPWPQSCSTSLHLQWRLHLYVMQVVNCESWEIVMRDSYPLLVHILKLYILKYLLYIILISGPSYHGLESGHPEMRLVKLFIYFFSSNILLGLSASPAAATHNKWPFWNWKPCKCTR